MAASSAFTVGEDLIELSGVQIFHDTVLQPQRERPFLLNPHDVQSRKRLIFRPRFAHPVSPRISGSPPGVVTHSPTERSDLSSTVICTGGTGRRSCRFEMAPHRRRPGTLNPRDVFHDRLYSFSSGEFISRRIAANRGSECSVRYCGKWRAQRMKDGSRSSHA